MAVSAKKLTATNLKPLPGYILVEPVDTPNKTESGIYLPDSHDEKPQQGEVLAVGAAWVTEYGAEIKPTVKKGDQVVYKKWGGNEVKVGEKEFQFLKFEDILAVVS